MTAEQATALLTAEMAKTATPTIGNMLDGIIGIVTNGQASTLQGMINNLAQKSGVLTAADQAAVQALLNQAAQERKKRQAIRLKNGLLIGGGVIVVGYLIYLSFKRKKLKS